MTCRADRSRIRILCEQKRMEVETEMGHYLGRHANCFWYVLSSVVLSDTSSTRADMFSAPLPLCGGFRTYIHRGASCRIWSLGPNHTFSIHTLLIRRHATIPRQCPAPTESTTHIQQQWATTAYASTSTTILESKFPTTATTWIPYPTSTTTTTSGYEADYGSVCNATTSPTTTAWRFRRYATTITPDQKSSHLHFGRWSCSIPQIATACIDGSQAAHA